MTLDHRVAVITGPKRMGHAVALDLASQGADIALIYRRRFLIASDFVTGETIRVDGGRHVR
jgi:NAD(P)-dependent dehydrogenase (short-subunit alcohol dehydrogenase family)